MSIVNPQRKYDILRRESAYTNGRVDRYRYFNKMHSHEISRETKLRADS